MSLENDVRDRLIATGHQLKDDLWHPDDLKTLAMIAADLVGLNAKAASPDLAVRDKARQAAARLVDHAALLALSRMNVAEKNAFEALKQFFLKLVSEWLPKLLGTLI